ncbi:MAG: hypothetical protein EZS28_004920 [Streblomastix strix]|uniref:Uncharacterized protein n=1 Tax=Streblomastix strix TaxID=222440 RepID=A0A5J4WWX3_9EUKA|nr:MAG: hypothetical protein EZS28_004920 [Streblomastix strix]
MIPTIFLALSLLICNNCKDIHPQPAISTNNACLFNVSQTIYHGYHKIAEVLEQNCTQSDGFDIALLDSTHVEQIFIAQESSILIKGEKEIPTIWSYAFLKFDNPPQNWTSDNIQDIIKDLFNNSISDARAGSIYYEMNHDNITYPGNITLPDHIQPSPEPIPEKKHNTKYIIIGVIVGFVIFILTAFAIFIVFRKSKIAYDPNDRRQLIKRGQYRST